MAELGKSIGNLGTSLGGILPGVGQPQTSQSTQQTQGQTQQGTSGQQSTGGTLPGVNPFKDIQNSNKIQLGNDVKTNVTLPGIVTKKAPTATISQASTETARRGYQRAKNQGNIEDMRSINEQLHDEMLGNEYSQLFKQGVKQTWDTLKKRAYRFGAQKVEELAEHPYENTLGNMFPVFKPLIKQLDKKRMANPEVKKTVDEGVNTMWNSYYRYENKINNNFAEWVDKNMNKILSKEYQDSGGLWESIKSGDTDNIKYGLMESFSSSALPMLPGIIAGFVTKNPTVTATIAFASTAPIEDQYAYEEAMKEGATREEAEAIGKYAGIINGALETAGEFMQLKGMLKPLKKNITKEITKKTTRQIIFKGLKEWASGIFGEGLTEGTQELVTNALIKTVNEDKDIWENVMDSIVAGGALGAGGSTLGAGGVMIEEHEKNKMIDMKTDIEAMNYVMGQEERKNQRMSEEQKEKVKERIKNRRGANTWGEVEEIDNQNTVDSEVQQTEEEIEEKTEEEIEEEMIDDVLNDEDEDMGDSKYQKNDSSQSVSKDTVSEKSHSGNITITSENSSEINQNLNGIKRNTKSLNPETFLQKLKESFTGAKGSNYIKVKINGRNYVMRISNHHANANTSLRHPQRNTSIVIKLMKKGDDGKTIKFKKNNKVNLSEFVYDPANLDFNKMNGIIDGIQNWMQTGEYNDTNFDKKNESIRNKGNKKKNNKTESEEKYQLKYEEEGYTPGVANKKEKSISGNEGIKQKNTINDETIEQLAEKYGVKVEVIKGMIEILKKGKGGIIIKDGEAYGKYRDQLLTLSEQIKESTAPHELLHAIFDMIDPETKTYLIAQVMKSEGWNAETAEERLADSFSNFFRTGKIEGAPKSTWGRIKIFFKRVRSFINGMNKWRNELEEIFTDIITADGIVDLQSKIDESSSLNKSKERMRKRFMEYRKNAIKTQERAESENKYQKAGDINSEAFKKRFGDSKVVDKDGNPLVVYHGTRYDIKIPNMKKGRRQAYGGGMYFTTNKQGAEHYANEKKNLLSFLRKPRVMEVYLSIQNPIKEGVYKWDNKWIDELKKLGYEVNEEYLSRKNVDIFDKYFHLRMLQDKKKAINFTEDFSKVTGYDGLVAPQSGGEEYWVAFKPSQVKSAIDNVGAYDANNDDIRYQKADSDQKDNDGRTLSNGQAEYFKDSKVRDDNGNLLKVYHGTNSEYTVYDSSLLGAGSGDLGFFGDGWYFATHKGEAGYYGRNIMEGYLNITNPFYYGNMTKIGNKDFGSNAYVTIRNLGKIDESINNMEMNGYKVSEIGDMVDDYLNNVKLEKLNDAKDPYNGWDITYWKVTEYGESEIKTAMKGLSENGMLDEQLNHYMMDKIGHLKPRDLIEEITDEARFDKTKKSFSQILQDKGYDGIVVGDNAYQADEIVAFRSNEFKNVDNLNPTDNEDIRYQRVYHGSPADFDRFDSSHMGEGEGAQAHGWGHYVAVEKDTGRHYADMGGGPAMEIKYKGNTIKDLLDNNPENNQGKIQVMSHMEDGMTFAKARDATIMEYRNWNKNRKDMLKNKTRDPNWWTEENLIKAIKAGEKLVEDAENLKEEDIKAEIRKNRNLYEVEIPDPVKKDTPTGKNYFEEDSFVNKNAVNEIVDKVKESGLEVGEKQGNWKGIDKMVDSYMTDKGVHAKNMYHILNVVLGGDKQASKFLESLGYDGIHYFGGRDGEAYVIFNDDALEIKNHEKYQKADIDSEATNPDELITKVGDTDTYVFDKFISEKAKDKALNSVPKEWLNDGKAPALMHTNKYDAKPFYTFANVKDSKYKRYGENIVVAFFTDNFEMSKSYADGKSVMAKTKIRDISDAELQEELKKMDEQESGEFKSLFGDKTRDVEYKHIVRKNKDGSVSLVKTDKSKYSYGYEKFIHDFTDETNLNELGVTYSEVFKQPDILGFLIDKINNKKDWLFETKAHREDGKIVVEINKEDELGTYPTMSQLKNTIVDKQEKNKYSYIGFAQNIKNPLIINEYKGEYWSSMGGLEDVFYRKGIDYGKAVDRFIDNIRDQMDGLSYRLEALNDFWANGQWRDNENVTVMLGNIINSAHSGVIGLMDEINNYLNNNELLEDQERALNSKTSGDLTEWGDTLKESLEELYDFLSKNYNEFRELEWDGIKEWIRDIGGGEGEISVLEHHYNPTRSLMKNHGREWDYNVKRNLFPHFTLETNDWVRYAIAEGYDAVKMEGIKDYGGDAKTDTPGNVYVTLRRGQYKAWDNTNPTDNDDIRYQKAGDTNSANFKKRFGDSKVVDENGNPLVVYHGTPYGGFTVFENRNRGSIGDEGYFGRGWYFTNDKALAKDYSDEAFIDEEERTNEPGAYGNVEIKEVYLKIENPYVVSEKDVEYEMGSLEKLLGTKNPSESTEKLKDEGYDGVIYEFNSGTKEYTVFEPNQIKSATDNVGTYDANNPDIRYQKTEYEYDENGNRKWIKFGDNSEFDPSIFGENTKEEQIAEDKENEKSNPFYNAWMKYNNQNYKDDQLTLGEFVDAVGAWGERKQEEFDKRKKDIAEVENDPKMLELQLKAVKLAEEETNVGKKFGKNVSKEVRDRQQAEVETKREDLAKEIFEWMYPGLKFEEATYDDTNSAWDKEAEWEMLGREKIEEKLRYFKKDSNGNWEKKNIKLETPQEQREKIEKSGNFDEIFTPSDRVIEWKTPEGQKGRLDKAKDPKQFKKVMEKINSGKSKTKVELKDVTNEVRALERYKENEKAEKERRKKEKQEEYAKKKQEEYKRNVRLKAFQRLVDMQRFEKFPFLSEDEIKQRWGFTDEEWKKITEQLDLGYPPKKRNEKAVSDFNKAVDSEVKFIIEGLSRQNKMKQKEAEKNLGEIGDIDLDVLLGKDEEKGQKEVEEFERIAKEEKGKSKKEKNKRLEQAREDVTQVEIDKERENSKSEKERVDKIIKSTKSDKTVWGNIKEFASDIVTPVSTRLKEISPKIYRELMKYFQNKDILTNQRLKEIDPFLKAMGKIRKENPVRFMDIRVALANRNIGYANGLLQEYGVKVPTKLLDTIYDEAEDVGLNINYLGSYYPLSVKAPQSFMEELMKSGNGDIASEIEKKIQEESVKKGGPLDESEVTAIINSVIAGEEKGPDVNVGNKHLKKRNTEIERTAKMLEYCDDPISTLIGYIEGMTQSIERAKFLGKSRSGNVHTLADYVYNAKNGLTAEQQDELMELLKSVFNDAGTHPAIQVRRDIATLTTLGSPSSTLTQISDLSFSVYENGWKEALKAVWDIFMKRKAFDLQDMGVINRGEEYTNINSQKNILQKAIHNVFKLTFFSKFDTFGKSTFIQSTWNKRRKRALRGENGDPQLIKDIMKITDDEYLTYKIINDLRNGVFSEEVALVMYMKLGNVQPLTKAQMPKAYLDNPNGRLFYQFKTFGIKQMDYVVQETKENLKGFKNLSTTEKFLRVAQIANMVFTMTLFGLVGDELKDITMRRKSNSLILRWLFGENVGTEQIRDKTGDNILKLFGLSRYSIMQMKNGNWDKAISDIFLSLPAMRTVDNVASDLHKAFKNDGSINWRNPSAYQAIPVIGKYRYWIYGGGQDKQQEALDKEKKTTTSGGSSRSTRTTRKTNRNTRSTR